MKKALFLLVLISSVTLHAQRGIPEWARGIFWYQIFPERFANGDTTNDPQAAKVFINDSSALSGWAVSKWTDDWFTMQDWEAATGAPLRKHLQYRRYGGDIKGIIDRLDYLQNLGVEGIYLNPVFDAVSAHKYDGSTYHHIDVNFGPSPARDESTIAGEQPDNPASWKWTGADSIFLAFLKDAHARGIRVILDGVFNHTGQQFWAFKDVVQHGASSKYANWYQVSKWDDPATKENEFTYKGWWNFNGLPEFNRTSDNLHPAVKEYIFAATRRWMDPNGDGNPEDGIDGWRLDVARDVPIGFWREWQQLVKSINPSAYITGELWELSPDFISANGVFDGLMNYNFAFGVNDFFVATRKKIRASEFLVRLKEIMKTYPAEYWDLLMNLVDSHDTERMVSMIMNPNRGYDRDGDERNTEYNAGKPKPEHYDRLKAIAAFQFTYKGAPMVYYGDEAGMWGADDPHCRKPMVWENLEYNAEYVGQKSGFTAGQGLYKVNVNKDLFFTYKKLAAIRKNSQALRTGSIEFLATEEDGIVAYKRTYGEENCIVVINTGERPELTQIPSGTPYAFDLFNGDRIKTENGKLNFITWPGSFSIYRY